MSRFCSGRGGLTKSKVSLYQPNGVVFDGTNDWLSTTTGFANVANGTAWTAAFALRLGGALGVEKTIIRWQTSGNGLIGRIAIDTLDKLQFQWRNSGASDRSVVFSTGALTTGQWYNVLFSVDVSVADSARLYLDDAGVRNVTVHTNDTLAFNQPHVGVGARVTNNDIRLNGELADLWVEFGRYVEFATESNRRKFFSSGGCLVDKGSDGSVPFGSAPQMFFSGSTAAWHTNKGSGGGMTLTGALGTSSVQPCGA